MIRAGLTAKEAAAYLGVGREHFRNHIAKRIARANLAGPRASRPMYRYHKDELDRFLKGQPKD